MYKKIIIILTDNQSDSDIQSAHRQKVPAKSIKAKPNMITNAVICLATVAISEQYTQLH